MRKISSKEQAVIGPKLGFINDIAHFVENIFNPMVGAVTTALAVLGLGAFISLHWAGPHVEEHQFAIETTFIISSIISTIIVVPAFLRILVGNRTKKMAVATLPMILFFGFVGYEGIEKIHNTILVGIANVYKGAQKEVLAPKVREELSPVGLLKSITKVKKEEKEIIKQLNVNTALIKRLTETNSEPSNPTGKKSK